MLIWRSPVGVILNNHYFILNLILVIEYLFNLLQIQKEGERERESMVIVKLTYIGGLLQQVHEADELLEVGMGEDCKVVADPRFSKYKLSLKGFPNEVYDVEWDLIMVDAPTGYHDEAPGRIVDASRSWGSTWLPNGWMRDLNLQRFLIQSLYLQKASGQGVRTHPPMMLLAMVKRGRYKSVGLLLGILRLPSSSCEGLYI